MIQPDEAIDIFRKYDRDNITVATVGSHTALQILKGAKDEGFKTLAVCRKGREVIYERFGVADRIITLDSYNDLLKEDVLVELQEENAVMVPHGSLVAYVGVENIEDFLEVPILGNRGIMRWESDRTMERKWLEDAGIKMPRETKDPHDIDGLSLVKFPGAKGGRGYFIVNNYRDFEKKSRFMLKKKRITQDDIENATIQEYISGVNMYLSYFYSPLRDEVELFGIDRRYEANIDGLTRIPAHDQVLAHIEPSYVVVGNAPIVARESLLSRVFEMGDDLVEVSKKIAPPGMFGPFCLETMVNEHLEFIAFEISARIVAGTNPFIDGSPYSYLQYGANMSMGRRIAVELKDALNEGKEELLLS
jgi:5-formaminoimidazole-4-carboxamide-1-(beta)-D-ribofuranosyl 5'-monophosphate synthetase